MWHCQLIPGMGVFVRLPLGALLCRSRALGFSRPTYSMWRAAVFDICTLFFPFCVLVLWHEWEFSILKVASLCCLRRTRHHVFRFATSCVVIAVFGTHGVPVCSATAFPFWSCFLIRTKAPCPGTGHVCVFLLSYLADIVYAAGLLRCCQAYTSELGYVNVEVMCGGTNSGSYIKWRCYLLLACSMTCYVKVCRCKTNEW